jgi:hypothetical protein
MAANYTVTSQRPSIQVLGPSSILDVMEVGARTIPSSVDFQVSIPLTTWKQNKADADLGSIASAIEGRLADDYIAGAYYTQDLDASGLLKDEIVFLVQLPNQPEMTAEVAVPVQLLRGSDTFQQQIVAQMFQDALAHLQATANL